MLCGDSLQGNFALSILHCCHKAPTFALFLCALTHLLKFCIQLRDVLPELLKTSFEVFIGNKESLLHVVLLYLKAGFARKNYQFADYIFAAKVYSWVWLAVAKLFCKADSLREWHIGSKGIEDVVERAAYNSLYL